MRACLLLLLAAATGCAAPEAAAPRRPVVAGRARVAVLPFRTAGRLDGAAVFEARPDAEATPEDAGAEAARLLAADLRAAGIAVVDADAVAGALSLVDARAYDPRLAARIADRVGAALAVMGALSHYRQRQGTALAVESPASVWYEAALVRAADGAVLTVDRFEYTQQPLSENILALPEFLRAGGKWLTREEILDGALARTADTLAATITGRPRPPGERRR